MMKPRKRFRGPPASSQRNALAAGWRGARAEDKEETEGAFVGYADCANGFDPACVAAMKPVKIRCLPANRPDGERIVLTFPPGHLLEKVGTTYQAAQSSYKANEIGGKSFWLHGHAASGALRDYEIKAEHSVNHCKDEAKHTVVKVDLDISTGLARQKKLRAVESSYVIMMGTTPRFKRSSFARWSRTHG